MRLLSLHHDLARCDVQSADTHAAQTICNWCTSMFFTSTSFEVFWPKYALQLQGLVKLPKLLLLHIWDPSRRCHCSRPALHSSVLADFCSHSSCFDLQSGAPPLIQRRLQLLLVVYVYDAQEETFLPVPDMPLGLSSHVSAVIQHLHQITLGEYQAMSQCLHHSCYCSQRLYQLMHFQLHRMSALQTQRPNRFAFPWQYCTPQLGSNLSQLQQILMSCHALVFCNCAGFKPS